MQCCSSSIYYRNLFPRPQISSFISYDCLVIAFYDAYKKSHPYYCFKCKLHVFILWSHLTLVAASYLNINYKDKMQLPQSMPYSCLSEVKLIWGAVFYFFGVFTMCCLWHVILSHLMAVQFKGWQLGLLRDHVFLRAWCAQILPVMQSLVCFLLKICCKLGPVCVLVFCAFQCTYWKFCQNFSQSAANLNKQICMFTWNKQLWHVLMCFI